MSDASTPVAGDTATHLGPHSVVEAPTPVPHPTATPNRAPQTPDLHAAVGGLRPETGHPVVLVDPRPESHQAVQRYREAGIPVVVLTSRRLEPAFHARGVQRHRVPAMARHPERWEARLLELAAKLEPRPILMPCSREAARLLRALHHRLAPHYAFTHLQSLQPDNLQHARTAEAALRRAIERGEPAMEVQLVVDRDAQCTAQCVLTWAPGARPDVIVSSVEGSELVDQSLRWVRERRLIGYARLVWAPDRHGRLALHASSMLPGVGWSLALEDGVDLPRQWYAALVGENRLPQTAARVVSKRLPILEPGNQDDTLPLAAYAPAWSWKDPLPWASGFLCSLVRR